MSKIIKAMSITLDGSPPYVVETPIYEPPPNPDEGIEDFGEDPLEIPDEPTAEDIIAAAEKKAASIIAKAEAEAAGIITIAKSDGEGMKAAAEAEIEMLKQEAASAARKQGYDEGYEKGCAEAEAIKDTVKAELDDTLKQREVAIAALEPELIDLVMDISQKLVGTAARINPQVVLHLVKEGLAASAFTGDMNLRVSKDDYDYVMAHKDELMGIVEGGAALEIIRDLNLNVGDCVIETDFGVIDASLGMQLDEVKENLSYIMRNM